MRRKRAFSLIELLVVIAVVALLIGLLLPALGAARKQARSIKCLAHLDNAGTGIALYHNDYDGYFPLSSHTVGNINDDVDNEDGNSWLHSLLDYGVTENARFCPEDPYRHERPASYATNDHFEPLVSGIDYDPFTKETLPGGRDRALNRIDLIPFPCAVTYAVESIQSGTVDHIHSIPWKLPQEIPGEIAVERHLQGSNFLFADAHAEWRSWAAVRDDFDESSHMFDPATAH